MSDKPTCCSTGLSANTKSSLLVSILCCAILFILVVGYVGKIQAVAVDNAARLAMLQQRVDQLDNQMAEVTKATGTTSQAEPAAAPTDAPAAEAPAATPESAAPAAPEAPATTTP